LTNVSNFSLLFTTFDILSSLVDSPSDIEYELGFSGNNIKWIANSIASGTYIVYKNGTINSSGTWLPGENIFIDIDGLPLGTYNYTIFVIDSYGLFKTDTVLVTVVSLLPPSITSPADLECDEGSVGNYIRWIATDLSPGTYYLYLNGVLNSTGIWSSGTEISINVDGHPIGTYNYTLVVTDQYGNSASDTVFVSVEESEEIEQPEKPSEPNNLIYLMILAVIVAIAVLLSSTRRRSRVKRQNITSSSGGIEIDDAGLNKAKQNVQKK